MLRKKPARLLSLFTFPAAGALLTGCDRADQPTEPSPDGDRVAAANHVSVTLDSETRGQLAGVRKATAPFQDVGAAMDAGYAQFSPHVPQMGIHYLTDDAIAPDQTSALDSDLDRSEPEILVYVDDAERSDQRRLVAAEYAVPKQGVTPPPEAVDLFSGADAGDWHVHPSAHELGLPMGWTVHGECHYEGGLGISLAEDPGAAFLQLTPNGPIGSWDGPLVEPADCPPALMGSDLLIAHGKWWTLHA